MNKRVIALSTFVGVLNQIAIVILSFTLRTSMLSTLGNEYVGLITVFGSIYSVLVALDGGMASNIFIKIQKPLANNDKENIKRTFNLLKIVYYLRAVFILLIGTLVLFCLPFLVKTDSINQTTIIFTYLLYMALSTINVAYIYNVFFVEAIQKRYLSTFIQFFTTIIFYGLNIILLYVFKNIYIYITLMYLGAIINNTLCKKIVYKNYPYLKKNRTKIHKEDFIELKALLGMAIHTFSDVIVNSTDNILMSIYLKLSTIGMFSNYKMIVVNIKNLINQLLFAIQDPLRRAMFTKGKETIEENIFMLLFIYSSVASFCSICLITLLDPFISLWLGEQYILDNVSIIMFIFGIYFSIVNYPVKDCYYCAECYKNDKKTPAFEIIINLVVSIVFGYFWGLTGIFLGTLLYYIYQTFKRSKVFYLTFFGKSNKIYIKKIMINVLFTIVVSMGIKFSLNYIVLDNLILEFFTKSLFSALTIVLLWVLCNYKSKYYHDMILTFKRILYSVTRK
ncbi:MAG: hypothetical protein RSE41_07420 [Clostridia bacterium]